MRRPLVVLAIVLAVVGLFVGGLAWLLNTPSAPPGSSRAARLYYGFCVTCHGVDGRGSWHAALFLLHPGDLADAERMRQHPDGYLFDIIKHGGANFGRPGMPAFGYQMNDQDIKDLVAYVRGLAR
jgi:mono/diheme cytochrome c family protein